MMRTLDMRFRVSKLDVMVVTKANKADTNRLLGSVYRYATEVACERTKKLLLVRLQKKQ